MRGADLMARGGLVMLLLAINGAVLLILDVVLDGGLPFVLSGLVLLWFVLALVRRPADGPGTAESGN